MAVPSDENIDSRTCRYDGSARSFLDRWKPPSPVSAKSALRFFSIADACAICGMASWMVVSSLGTNERTCASADRICATIRGAEDNALIVCVDIAEMRSAPVDSSVRPVTTMS